MHPSRLPSQTARSWRDGAHEAGVNLVRAEDQLRLMQRQNNDLTMRRKDSERMLSEIEAVNNNNIIIIIPLLYIVLFS